MLLSQGGQREVVQMFEVEKEIHFREEFPPRGSVLGGDVKTSSQEGN